MRHLPKPLSENETLEDFLARLGHPAESLGGHSQAIHAHFFAQTLKENPWIKNIAEVGFNAGHSAEMLLRAAGVDTQMVSFDIMQHAYSHLGKLYIDARFARQHTLIAGNSNESVPTYLAHHPRQFDLIFIDGGHGVKTAYHDILHFKQAAHDKTIVIIDNVAPHKPIGHKVYKAWRQALDEEHLIHLSHHETEDYADGWVLAQYTSHSKPSAGTTPDYAHIERKLAFTG